MIPLIIILSVIVIYVDWHRTYPNWGTQFNGIGSVGLVNAGHSQAPMQYRVLIPWICSLWKSDLTYHALRWVAVIGSFAASALYFMAIGINVGVGLLLLAAYFVYAALYDYTDGYLEVAFDALCFYLLLQQPPFYAVLIGIITVVATLNRETAAVIPLAAILLMNIPAFIASSAGFIVGYIIPRIKYGHKGRYCAFSQISNNMKSMRNTLRLTNFLYNEYTNFILLTIVTICLYFVSWQRDGLAAIDYACAALYIGLLIPTMWREIRVFAPTLLATIPMGVRLLI